MYKEDRPKNSIWYSEMGIY